MKRNALIWIVLVCMQFSSASGVTPMQSAEAMAATDRGDFATAFRLWQELAGQGDASAQANLGYMYERGDGVTQDFAQALKWYSKSAEQGHAKGQLNLGWLYETGKGVSPDFGRAAGWYRKAAVQGHPQAQLNFGTLYYNGQGVPKDFFRSYMWLDLAASTRGGKQAGDAGALEVAPMTPSEVAADRQTAERNRAIIASKMSAEQIKKAQVMVKECRVSRFRQCG